MAANLMKVLIDGNGLQAQVPFRPARLKSLLEVIDSLPSQPEVRFLDEPLTRLECDDGDVLLIPTHTNPYTDEELNMICGFVEQGGGLFLMSNHGDWPARGNTYDAREFDAELAARFDITLERSWYAGPPGELVEIDDASFAPDHLIISGGAAGKPVQKIVTNNCCGVLPADASPIVWLPQIMHDKRNDRSVEGRAFAVALEKEMPTGRVVVVGDSGFIGSCGTTKPGPGLLECGDNAQFIKNSFLWLSRNI